MMFEEGKQINEVIILINLKKLNNEIKKVNENFEILFPAIDNVTELLEKVQLDISDVDNVEHEMKRVVSVFEALTKRMLDIKRILEKVA